MNLKWLDGKGWETLTPIASVTGCVVVPPGFVSDGLTLPKAARVVVDRQGPGLRAALIHDWMYINAYISKDFADKVFYDQLIDDGVPEWKAIIMYHAVKLFGEGNY